VDYITSPGFIKGGNSRAESGLIAGGMYRVVTDLAMLGFDAETKEMNVESPHPGVDPEEVKDNTGFDIAIADHVGRTEPPQENELAVLRNLDPDRLYTA